MAADHNRVAVFSSENRANIPVYPLDTFVVTEAGAAELNSGTTRLPPEARARLGLARGTRLPTIAGRVPELTDVPSGCAFADRCAQAVRDFILQSQSQNIQ